MELVKLSNLVCVEEALRVPSCHCTDLPACVRPPAAQCPCLYPQFVPPGTENPGTWGICALESHIQVVVKPFDAALQMPPTEAAHARVDQRMCRAEEISSASLSPTAQVVTVLSGLLLAL